MNNEDKPDDIDAIYNVSDANTEDSIKSDSKALRGFQIGNEYGKLTAGVPRPNAQGMRKKSKNYTDWSKDILSSYTKEEVLELMKGMDKKLQLEYLLEIMKMDKDGREKKARLKHDKKKIKVEKEEVKQMFVLPSRPIEEVKKLDNGDGNI